MITKMVEPKKQAREPLTDRQQVIYNFIRNTIAAGRPSPTVREIGDEFGIKSPNGVMAHLKALQRKGWINREDYAARSITLVSEPRTEFITLTPGQSLNVGGVMVGVVGVGETEVNLEVIYPDNQELTTDE